MEHRKAICFTRYAGPSSMLLCIGDLDLYYSYKTVVAYRNGARLFCSENQWGVTTGKHLDSIVKDKSKRLEWNRFKAGLMHAVRSRGYEV